MEFSTVLNDVAKVKLVQAAVAEACGPMSTAEACKQRAQYLMSLDSEKEIKDELENIHTRNLIRTVVGF
jgi:hypothetical protein